MSSFDGRQDLGGGGGEAPFDQPHEEVVPGHLWWWLACIAIAAVAVVANLVFLLTVIYNRSVLVGVFVDAAAVVTVAGGSVVVAVVVVVVIAAAAAVVVSATACFFEKYLPVVAPHNFSNIKLLKLNRLFFLPNPLRSPRTLPLLISEQIFGTSLPTEMQTLPFPIGNLVLLSSPGAKKTNSFHWRPLPFSPRINRRK